MNWDDAAAQWYADHYGEYATNRLAVDALDIPDGAVVVDVGCGTGAALRHVARRVPDATLIGVDPVPRMRAIAKERAAAAGVTIAFRDGRAEQIPVADGTVDFLFAFDVMDHVADRDAAMREARRVLRPNGQWVVVKDSAVPGQGADAFVEELTRAEFVLISQTAHAEGDVAFVLWVCTL